MKKLLLILTFVVPMPMSPSVDALKYAKNLISSHPIEAAATLAVLGGATYGAYTYYCDQRTGNPLSTVIKNPATALSDIAYQYQSAKDSLEPNDATQADEYTLIKFNNVIQTYEKKSPIFLLGECTGGDYWACPLSRTYQPKYRDRFETKVVNKLVEKLESSPQEGVQYVGFGCGEMFQDLVIICKTLTKKPSGLLSIHLIDPTLFALVELRDARTLNHQITDEDSIDLSGDVQDLITYVRQHGDKEIKEASDALVKQTLQLEYATIESRAKQFISFLKKSFPNVTLNLYLHTSGTGYLEYIKNHNIPYPDIICAADIDGEMSACFGNSLYHYACLCTSVLQNKPDAYNLLLARKNEEEAQLESVSLEKTYKADKETCKLSDDQTVDVFVTRDDIE